MAVVGTAEILITPVSAGFAKELEAQTSPGLGNLKKDSEKAGEDAGSKLSSGFGKGTKGIASTLSSLGVPLGSFGGKLDKTADSMGRVGSKGEGMVGTLSKVGGATLLGAAAAVVGVGTASIMAASKYQSATTTIAAQAGISVGAAKKITDAFLSTAGHTIYSAQTIATAYGQVAGVLGATAGHALSASEASKVMAASMDLAEGAGIQLGSATEAVAKTMQAYHLNAGQASGASDVLFSASKDTGISVESLAQGLTKVKSKLGDLAPSLEESAGLLNALAKSGVTGRASISALSGSFTTLVGGGKPATEMAEKLGISIFNSQGKFVGMKSIVEQLSPKLQGLSQETQLQATKALFGASANKQLLNIVLQGPNAFEKDTAAVTKAGAAHEAAQKQSKTLSHEFELLKATATDLAVKFGNVLIPIVTKLGQALAGGIEWLTKHKEACKALAVVIATVLGAAVSIFVEQKVVAFGTGVAKMITNMGSLVSGIKSGVAKIVGYFTAEGVGAEAAATVVGTAGVETVAAADATAVGVDTALGATGVGLILVGLGLAAFELKEHWTEVMGSLEEATKTAGNAIIEILNAIIRGFNETVGELTGSIGELKKVGEVASEEAAGQAGLANAEKGLAAAQKAHPGVTNKISASGRQAALEGEGLSKNAAAGIIAAYGAEGGTPTAVDPKEGAYGLAQWTESRKAALAAFAKSKGEPISSERAQLQFTAKEVKERGELGGLNSAKSPKEAADLFIKNFERPQSDSTVEARVKATSLDTDALTKHTAALANSIKGLAEGSKTTKATKAAKATKLFTPHGGTTGFFEASGTNYTEGKEEEIAARLDALAKAQKIKLTGVSGYRSPAHSVAVGGFANDPHTRGEASDTEGAQKLPEALLKKFGLTRPFSGAKEADHIQLLPGVEALKKGGSQLQTASSNQETLNKAVAAVQKKEATRIASDQKVGTSTLNKMVAAIHSGGVKELEKVVTGVHEKEMKKLEAQLDKDHKDALKGMAGEVEKEHASALSKMVSKLTEVHKKALEALQVALVKAAEKNEVEADKAQDVISSQAASNIAEAIADSTKVTLDQAAQAGLSGAALLAAEAQTNLDAVKGADDAAIGAAKLVVDQTTGKGELPEENAAKALSEAENAAKVNEAEAQAHLDLANNAAAEAAKAEAKVTEENTKATEKATKAQEEATKAAEAKAATPPVIYLTLNAAGMSAGQAASEIGWALRTGALPVAPPVSAAA